MNRMNELALLAAEYEELVGYNPVEDDPSMSLEDLRELLEGMKREMAA